MSERERERLGGRGREARFNKEIPLLLREKFILTMPRQENKQQLMEEVFFPT